MDFVYQLLFENVYSLKRDKLIVKCELEKQFLKLCTLYENEVLYFEQEINKKNELISSIVLSKYEYSMRKTNLTIP